MLILCLFISMTPITAFAKSSSKETYDLTIRTEKDFIQFIKNIEKGKNYKGKKIKLEKDIKINAKDVGDFDLLYDMRKFSGTFDGGCNTISGIHSWKLISDFGSNSLGALFGSITSTGVVKNLYINDFTFESEDRGASVIAVNNDGLIENCRIRNCKLNASSSVAGIVQTNNGKIRNCTVEGEMVCDGVYSSGITVNNHGSVVNCAFVGSVTRSLVQQGPYLAGIVTENDGNIQNCYGAIRQGESISNEKVYGICGRNSGKMSNCYAYDERFEFAYAYASSSGTTNNVVQYINSEMTRTSFVKKMNAKLPSNSLKWGLTKNSDYPSLISLYEVTFKSIDSKKAVIKSNKSYAGKGQKIKLTPSVDKKYKLNGITIKTAKGKKVQVKKEKGVYTFTMSGEKVEVTAKIVKK